MPRLLLPTAILSSTSCAALFGFFYAWVCSTMWGLDATDPKIAIAAMQAMNASVRNAVFAPVFFGTPVFLALTSFMLLRSGNRIAAGSFGLAALLVLFLGTGLTMMVPVPLNETLASTSIPQDLETARQVWQDYSIKWQFWNQTRTITTGLAFVCAAYGLCRIRS